MLSVNKLIPGGRGLAGALVKRAATVELDWDVRQKSRFDATDSQGRALGVFLSRGSTVRGGDVLVAEDGSLLRVIAAPQPVLQVTAPAGGSPLALMRAAYHLGNRHVALELAPGRLQLEPDHVLAEMLTAMGLMVAETNAPFEPEGGAYAAGGHGHSHGHAHGHAHGHSHDPDPDPDREPAHRHERAQHEHTQGHAHAPPATPPAADRGRPAGIAVTAAPHVHGPGCGHDHR